MNQNKFAMGLSKSGAGSTGLGVGPAVSSDFLSPPSAHSSSSSSRHLAAFFSSGEQLTSPDKRKSCSSDSLSHQQQPPLPAHQHQQHSSTPASARNSVFRNFLPSVSSQLTSPNANSSLRNSSYHSIESLVQV